jgi:hypothetical protein
MLIRGKLLMFYIPTSRCIRNLVAFVPPAARAHYLLTDEIASRLPQGFWGTLATCTTKPVPQRGMASNLIMERQNRSYWDCFDQPFTLVSHLPAPSTPAPELWGFGVPACPGRTVQGGTAHTGGKDTKMKFVYVFMHYSVQFIGSHD